MNTKTKTLTATDGMGNFLASCEIRTGSQNGARRVPASFIRTLNDMSPIYGIRLNVNVSRGTTARTLKRVGGVWYTRVQK